MKKLSIVIILALFMVGSAVIAFAAGTVTPTRDMSKGRTAVQILTFTWTADASDGSVPDTDFDAEGYVTLGVTNPGTPAPTDNYDIEVKDTHGNDVMGGALNDRDTANSEQAAPLAQDGLTPIWRFVSGKLTFSLSGNSVNSATGVVVLYIHK